MTYSGEQALKVPKAWPRTHFDRGFAVAVSVQVGTIGPLLSVLADERSCWYLSYC